MNIIVLNCYSRNALAVISSVDPGYRVIGGTVRRERFRWFNPDRWFHTRRLAAIFRHADPCEDAEGFVADLAAACRTHQADAVIATGTEMTNALSRHKERLQALTSCRILVEDYAKLELLADKWQTTLLCQRLNVPTPRTILAVPDAATLQELTSFRFPVILKQRWSSASKGVRFANSPSEVNDILRDNDLPILTPEGDPNYVIQEVIRGNLHDVTSCAKEGRTVSILTQQRMLSLYDFGGGGIINRTTREPESMAYAETILRELAWNGVLLFDFIRDPEGRYYLLECNPKFWGTTQLTIDAGLNVAQNLIDLFVLNRELPRQDRYQEGLLYKWWVPDCVFHWFQHPPRTLGQIASRIAKTFRNYDAQATRNNLDLDSLLHAVGIVLDRS